MYILKGLVFVSDIPFVC